MPVQGQNICIKSLNKHLLNNYYVLALRELTVWLERQINRAQGEPGVWLVLSKQCLREVGMKEPRRLLRLWGGRGAIQHVWAQHPQPDIGWLIRDSGACYYSLRVCSRQLVQRLWLEWAWCTEGTGAGAPVGRGLRGGLSGGAGSGGHAGKAAFGTQLWPGSDGHVTGPCIFF